MKLEALEERRPLIIEHMGYERLKSLLFLIPKCHIVFFIHNIFLAHLYISTSLVCYSDTEGYVFSWKMVTLVDIRKRE